MANETETTPETTPETPETPSVPALNPDAIRELLDTLIPPGDTEIEDALGNVYRISTRLPARAEVMVIREIEALADLDVDPAAFRTGSAPNLIRRMIGLATDPRVLDALCHAFEIAHPRTVARAREAAYAAGTVTAPGEVSDLFGLEAIVSGLIPFVARLLRRALDLIERVTAAA